MAKARILIVEDESVVAKDIQIRLKGLGYAVCAIASSGEGAIQKAAETHPDLVLMDIVLKGDMDGIEATKEIISRYDIPVVYLTAYADEKTLERAKISDPYGYILKPFEDRELQSTVEIALYKHEMKQKLQESEKRYRTIFENTGTATAIIEEDTTLSMVNTQFEELCGYPREELQGKKSWTEFVAKEDLERMKEYHGLRRSNPHALPTTYEFRFMDKQGNSKDILLSVAMIPGTKKSVASLSDITERKQAEKALREADRMKSEFISVVGHELRTPLTSMKNAIDIVLGETAGAVNENQRRFLSMAERNIDRLTGIINDLLDIFKIGSGRIRIELKPLDLCALLDMVIASLTSKTKEKSNSIHQEIPSDLPQAYGDSDKLEQIFINLLDNAIKFTPEGGEVFVSAKEYELDSDFIEISVADTGVGIPADELEKIFDRFYQVEKSITKEIKGTGLGLSIVKGLVEAHGGRYGQKARWVKPARLA